MIIVFDLDDTLYDEVDYVRSGFKEVANYLGDDTYFDFMWKLFKKDGSGKIFNKLIDRYNLKTPLLKLLEIYRFHTPNINLPHESLELLKFSSNYKTALITDGHYIMQKNKYNALKLSKFIDFPIFTDFFHTSKPELKPYQLVMDRYTNEQYIYISDNPKKDFKATNKLGWNSIRFKNPNGIYRDFSNDANYEVESRVEIIDKLREICEN